MANLLCLCSVDKIRTDEPIRLATCPSHATVSPGVIVKKFKVQLRLTGTGTFGNVKIDTPLQSVTVEAEATTFVDAVNKAVHKLSNLLSKREA